MAVEVQCCGTKFALFVMIIVGLVCFAGLMAGLTLGLMSLGLVDLEVLMKSGPPRDRTHAAKIYPVVKNQHLLLCTLLIGNAMAMETLPIFLDALVPSWAAILISVTLILMFGEILPQAICTRYGLIVGATLAPFVNVLLVVFYPISYPISKVLDWMLGKGHAALLKRAELKTFVNFHGNEAGKGGDLTHDETTIITGALELTEKTAKDAMTPISKAFSLDLDAALNLDTLNTIMTLGHSRVPVYAGEPRNIIGLVLVKNLFMVDSKAAVPLRKMIIRKIPRVSENMPLYDILNEFQKGHSHIAVVYRDLNDKNDTPKRVKDRERCDFKDSCKNKEEKAPLDKGVESESGDTLTTIAKVDGSPRVKKSPPVSPAPAFKKRHRGCSRCILDVDNAPMPVFPPNEVVVGVITMEDVIEELLQEEILDETDEYVNIHNKIKVNMNASKEKSPNAIPVQPSPNAIPVQPSPNAIAVQPSPNAIAVQPSPNAIPVQPSPNAIPVQQSPNAIPVQPSPNAIPVQQSPNAIPVQPSPNAIPDQPSPLAAQEHTPTSSVSTAISATGSPTRIDQISENNTLRNQ